MEKLILWKDGKRGTVEPTLFSKTAEDMAKAMGKEHEGSRGKANRPSQIRKFYDEVVRLEQASRARPGNWENVLPQIHMLTAKAAYARGRELVSEGFLNHFIKSAVNQIQGPEDLYVFANFFEAFMGFYRLHGPRN